MKKLTLLALAFMLTSSVFCQTSKESTSEDNSAKSEQPKKSGDARYQEILKALNLSVEQKAQLKEINKNSKEAKLKVEADTTLSDSDKKDRLKQIRKEKTNSFMGILTPEQVQLYKEMKKQNAEKKEKED